MRSYIDSLNFRKLGRDFIGHSVAEIGAVRLRAQVLQRKDGNGRLGGYGPGGRRRMFSYHVIPPNASRKASSASARKRQAALCSEGLVVRMSTTADRSRRVRGALHALQVRAQLGRGLVAQIPVFIECLVDDLF
jgi:hypothetical protein